MAKREEKLVEEIRRLQKKKSSENSRCFNCTQKVRLCSRCGAHQRARKQQRAAPQSDPMSNAQGPQYVCLDFHVFVCSGCSGIQCACVLACPAGLVRH